MCFILFVLFVSIGHFWKYFLCDFNVYANDPLIVTGGGVVLQSGVRSTELVLLVTVMAVSICFVNNGYSCKRSVFR